MAWTTREGRCHSKKPTRLNFLMAWILSGFWIKINALMDMGIWRNIKYVSWLVSQAGAGEQPHFCDGKGDGPAGQNLRPRRLRQQVTLSDCQVLLSFWAFYHKTREEFIEFARKSSSVKVRQDLEPLVLFFPPPGICWERKGWGWCWRWRRWSTSESGQGRACF